MKWHIRTISEKKYYSGLDANNFPTFSYKFARVEVFDSKIYAKGFRDVTERYGTRCRVEKHK